MEIFAFEEFSVWRSGSLHHGIDIFAFEVADSSLTLYTVTSDGSSFTTFVSGELLYLDLARSPSIRPLASLGSGFFFSRMNGLSMYDREGRRVACEGTGVVADTGRHHGDVKVGIEEVGVPLLCALSGLDEPPVIAKVAIKHGILVSDDQYPELDEEDERLRQLEEEEERLRQFKEDENEIGGK